MRQAFGPKVIVRVFLSHFVSSFLKKKYNVAC